MDLLNNSFPRIIRIDNYIINLNEWIMNHLQKTSIGKTTNQTNERKKKMIKQMNLPLKCDQSMCVVIWVCADKWQIRCWMLNAMPNFSRTKRDDHWSNCKRLTFLLFVIIQKWFCFGTSIIWFSLRTTTWSIMLYLKVYKVQSRFKIFFLLSHRRG